MSVAWEDRKSAKSNTVSDSVQRKRNSLKDLWSAICAMLQDFKYWLVEGSLHEPLKPPKEFNDKDDAIYPAKKPHRTFKEVQTSSLICDKCRKPARLMKYQCTDCDQGYCTDCWPRTQKRGAHLEDGGEQRFDPKHHLSIHIRTPEPLYSATSSSDISPTQELTEYVPLRYIEEGGCSLLPSL